MSIYEPHSAANLLGPLRNYISTLMTWAKKRATSYGIAAALILGAILFIGIAAGVGAAALFHWIELNYGAWTAFSVIGGFFAAVGLIALLVALILLRRGSPPLPAPPDVTHLFGRMALPMASRLASETRRGTDPRADGTTRLLATGAALFLIAWAVTSRATRRSHLGGARK